MVLIHLVHGTLQVYSKVERFFVGMLHPLPKLQRVVHDLYTVLAHALALAIGDVFTDTRLDSERISHDCERAARPPSASKC